MTTHKVIDGHTGKPIERKTLHRSGLYAVSNLKMNWHLFIITHVPSGLTITGATNRQEAIRIADALDRAFKSTGKGVCWGDSRTLATELNSMDDFVKVCAAARGTNSQ